MPKASRSEKSKKKGKREKIRIPLHFPEYGETIELTPRQFEFLEKEGKRKGIKGSTSEVYRSQLREMLKEKGIPIPWFLEGKRVVVKHPVTGKEVAFSQTQWRLYKYGEYPKGMNSKERANLRFRLIKKLKKEGMPIPTYLKEHEKKIRIYFPEYGKYLDLDLVLFEFLEKQGKKEGISRSTRERYLSQLRKLLEEKGIPLPDFLVKGSSKKGVVIVKHPVTGKKITFSETQWMLYKYGKYPEGYSAIERANLKCRLMEKLKKEGIPIPTFLKEEHEKKKIRVYFPEYGKYLDLDPLLFEFLEKEGKVERLKEDTIRKRRGELRKELEKAGIPIFEFLKTSKDKIPVTHPEDPSKVILLTKKEYELYTTGKIKGIKKGSLVSSKIALRKKLKEAGFPIPEVIEKEKHAPYYNKGLIMKHLKNPEKSVIVTDEQLELMLTGTIEGAPKGSLRAMKYKVRKKFEEAGLPVPRTVKKLKEEEKKPAINVRDFTATDEEVRRARKLLTEKGLIDRSTGERLVRAYVNWVKTGSLFTSPRYLREKDKTMLSRLIATAMKNSGRKEEEISAELERLRLPAVSLTTESRVSEEAKPVSKPTPESGPGIELLKKLGLSTGSITGTKVSVEVSKPAKESLLEPVEEKEKPAVREAAKAEISVPDFGFLSEEELEEIAAKREKELRVKAKKAGGKPKTHHVGYATYEGERRRMIKKIEKAEGREREKLVESASARAELRRDLLRKNPVKLGGLGKDVNYFLGMKALAKQTDSQYAVINGVLMKKQKIGPDEVFMPVMRMETAERNAADFPVGAEFEARTRGKGVKKFKVIILNRKKVALPIEIAEELIK